MYILQNALKNVARNKYILYREGFILISFLLIIYFPTFKWSGAVQPQP